MIRRAALTDLRLAWWLGRGQVGRIWLLIACIAIGVSARVAVGTLSVRIDRALAREARPLLGGDLEISAARPLDDGQRAALAASLPPGATTLDQVSLVTMAAAGDRAALVEVRAISPGYPLAGRTRALDAAGRDTDARALSGDQALALLPEQAQARLGIAPGDTLRLGGGAFTVAGTLLEDPGLGANPFAFGPLVLIAREHLLATGLASHGSRVRHVVIVALADPTTAEPVADAIRAALDAPAAVGASTGAVDAQARVRTARQAERGVQRLFDRLGDFLRLVALIALLLGGVGVASLVRGFVIERMESCAMLQVLGASGWRVLRVVLLLTIAVGVAGGVLGAAAGTAIADLACVAARRSFGFELGWGPDARACLWGLGLGALVAAAFAALPLIELRRLRPLAVLRGEPPPRAGRWAMAGAALALTVLFAGVAGVETRSWKVGPASIAILAIGSALAAAGGALVLAVAGRLRAAPFGFAIRHGLANLARPGYRPVAAVAAIAACGLLAGNLAVHQASIGAELDGDTRDDLPSLFVIELQTDQLDDFRALVRREAAAEPTMAPVVTARLRSISGQDVAARRGPPLTREQEGERFLKDREQRLSWREQPGDGEQVIAGRWMDPASGQVEASLEERFADSIGAGLGDVLRFDVQGTPVEATVTSLRRVRWTTFAPNFLVLVSRAAIVDAPQSWIASVPPLAAPDRQRVQARLAAAFPNATSIDLGDAGKRLRDLVGRAAAAVRFLGLFCLGSGLAVLAGIAASTARQRRTDTALLRALGAGDRVLRTALLVEFAAIGATAAVLGVGLGAAVGWVQMTWLLNLRGVVPWGEIAATAAAITGITALCGILATRRALRVPALAVLRES